MTTTTLVQKPLIHPKNATQQKIPQAAKGVRPKFDNDQIWEAPLIEFCPSGLNKQRKARLQPLP